MTMTSSVGLLCNKKVHQNNGRHITLEYLDDKLVNLVDNISKNI